MKKILNVFRKVKNYWINPKDEQIQKIKNAYLTNQTLLKKLTVSALLSAVAAALQSAGALGGVGFIFSALVTLPISLAALLSLYSGLMSYLATLLLLVILQPSELIIFPFTTGLLGLSIGISYKFLKRKIAVVMFTALCLTFGIVFLLYVLKFPVFGSEVSGSINFMTVFVIYVASAFYSWIWHEVALKFLKSMDSVFTNQKN